MARLSGRPLLDTRADAALFVDRDAELDRLIRAVAEGLNVLVSGARGLGRTSLLRQLAYRMAGGQAVRVLDATSWTEPGAFLHRVAGAVGIDTSTLGQTAAGDVVARLSAAVSPLGQGTDEPQSGVLAVDGLSPAVAQVVFGQLRDEIWRVPLTWLVSCAEVDEPAFLRPPADAFFDTTVRLPPLTDEAVSDLLRRRATPAELSDDAVSEIVAVAGGNPRRAIDLARHLVLAPTIDADAVTAVRDRLLQRDETVARLGSPARMLLAELEASGGASASDERLLERLGWTRPRAAQVLGLLERAGLVEATDEQRVSGRPRRVYRSKDWLTG